ncbi:ubiquilin-1-like [Tiliqua scincoides]|uniref:ubiquilin-1-like n=1 Tax=Tiliqua scincoides TaxID=71010 RepID=UPI003463431E
MVESQKIPGVDLGATTEPPVVRIVVKTPWQKEEFLVRKDMFVRELKEHISRHFSSSPDHVVLVYAGRILKDHKSLGQHGIHLDNDATVYVVLRGQPSRQGSSTPVSSSVNPGAPRSSTFASEGLQELTTSLGLNTANFAEFQSQLMSNPEMMLQLLENPFVQRKLSSPDLMKELVTDNPQVRQVMQKAPEISHVFSSPEGMRLVVELARNPAAVREIIKSPPQALSYPRSVSGGDNNGALQDLFVEGLEAVPKVLPRRLGTSPSLGSPTFDPGQKAAPARAQQPSPHAWPPKHPATQSPAASSHEHSKGESGSLRGEAGQLASTAVKNLLHQIIKHLLQNIVSAPGRSATGQGQGHAPDLVAKLLRRNPAAPGHSREQAPLQVPALLQEIQSTDVLLASWSPKEIQGLLEIQQRLQALATDEPAGRHGRSGRPARRARSITSLCDALPPTLRVGHQEFPAQQILQLLVGTDFPAGAKAAASHLRGSSAQPSPKQKRM